MRFRTYKNTDLKVSEVGFGLWTISTGWWGNFTEGEAIALMHKAFDLGLTLFDAADTYGNGLSEELIAKAFPNQREEIVIATKVGYDFVHHGNLSRVRKFLRVLVVLPGRGASVSVAPSIHQTPRKRSVSATCCELENGLHWAAIVTPALVRQDIGPAQR